MKDQPNGTGPSAELPVHSHTVWIEAEERVSLPAANISPNTAASGNGTGDENGRTVNVWLEEAEDLTVRPVDREQPQTGAK